MSACKAEPDDSSKEAFQPQSSTENRPSDPVGKYFKGYSSMVFLRRGKHKRKQSRSNISNLSKELQGSEKKGINVSSKKCEVLGFEEVSNEFTCDSSLMESYHLNTTKEAKFSFRKLEDGTFVLETKTTNEPEKSGSSLKKRSSKTRHKNGHYSHKPLKICFKKRSKTLRKSSDSNDDFRSENVTVPCSVEKQDITCVANNQDENALHDHSTGKTWANFKRLITRRRKLHSSLKRQSQLSGRHLEASTSGTCIQRVSQKKRFSNLRIPCMNFSRAKRSAKLTLPSEDPLCTVNTSETCGTELEDNGKRNKEALAAKCTPQSSLEEESRKTDISLEILSDICSKSPISLDQKEDEKHILSPSSATIIHQNVSSFEEIKCNFQQSSSEDIDHQLKMNSRGMSDSPAEGQDLICARPNLPRILITNGLMDEEIPILDDDIGHITDEQIDDASPHMDSEDEMNEQFLVNGIATLVDPKSDLYEFLLMRTAASLVSKVIQSSIQQIVEEDTLLNHSPCRASERFYI